MYLAWFIREMAATVKARISAAPHRSLPNQKPEFEDEYHGYTYRNSARPIDEG